MENENLIIMNIFGDQVMKIMTILLIAVMFVGCGKTKKEGPLSKTETASVALPSMVCGTCEKTIEKAAYRVEGVKNVEIDLSKKMAQITFVPFQTNLDVIETAITEAGYDANKKKRNPDAYEELDACCKIDG